MNKKLFGNLIKRLRKKKGLSLRQLAEQISVSFVNISHIENGRVETSGVLDCFGNCNGSSVLDDCDVCGGDNSSCSDCAGVPNGDSWSSDCGCVAAGNSGDDCDDCAGVPDGSSVEDECGTCDDDSSNDCVQDCAGQWGGSAEEQYV